MFADAPSVKARPESGEHRRQVKRVLGDILRNKPTKSFCSNTRMFEEAEC